MSAQEDEVWEASEGGCYVALTHDHLNVQQVMDRVRSPAAGAIVLFAGKTHFSIPTKQIHKNGILVLISFRNNKRQL